MAASVIRSRRAARLALALSLVAAVCALLLGGASQARADQNPKEQFDVVGENYHGKLTAKLAPAQFPERRLLLTMPQQASPLPPDRVHILEDGQLAAVTLTALPGAPGTNRYALTYRSARPYGEREVELAVRVDGVDAADLDYDAPASASSAAHQALPPSGGDVNDRSGTGASHTPFLASRSARWVVPLGAGALLVLGLLLWLGPRRRRHGLRDRVGHFAAASAASPSPGVVEALSPAERLAATERLLAHLSWWGAFKERVELARVRRSAVELVAIDAVATGALAALGGLLAGPAAALLALVLGPLALRLFVGRRVRKQRELFSEQLGGVLDELSSSLRAGHGLVAALATSVRNAPEPSRAEWGKVVSDETLGVGLDEAMRSLARRMASDDVEQVALVSSLHQRTGGNMAEVLDRVADGVRERAELRRQLRTLSAQARMSRWILTALPVVIALLMLLLDPAYARPLYTTTGGLVALGVAASLLAAGSLILRKLTEIEV